jgi:hypothetical protein
MNVACHRDCCRDGAVVATAMISSRIDAKSCDTGGSLIPADSTRFLLRSIARTALHRGAPPGVASPPVRPLSLRI